MPKIIEITANTPFFMLMSACPLQTCAPRFLDQPHQPPHDNSITFAWHSGSLWSKWASSPSRTNCSRATRRGGLRRISPSCRSYCGSLEGTLLPLTSLSLPWSFRSRPLHGAARYLSHIIRRLHVIYYF